MRHALVILGCFLATLPDVCAQTGASVTPPELAGVGIDQRLNEPVPLGLVFRDEQGRTVQLNSYFTSRPVIVTLVYYQCPMLCTMVLNGLVRSLRGVNLHPGRDFEIVTVSFDPKETPVLAAQKKSAYLKRYGSPDAERAWHFLTGDEQAISQLTKAMGFRYRYDPVAAQFAHPSAIMALTPDGRISRYFYGVEYPARDLRLGLVEASEGKIGTPVDQALLFCYHYNPSTGKYGVAIWRVIRVLSILLLAVLTTLLVVLFRRDRRDGPARRHAGIA